MELNFPKKSSMEFHWTWSIWYLKKIFFLDICLMIMGYHIVCYIALISTSYPGFWTCQHPQKWAKHNVHEHRQFTAEVLTHWGRVTHICVGNLTIIGWDNGLSPGWRQAIISTNAEILLIGPWGTNFSEILIQIQTFSFKKMHLKMASAKWRPFCLSLNVLRNISGSSRPCRPFLINNLWALLLTWINLNCSKYR